MNITILEEKENSLLNRKEFLLKVDSSGKTPTNEELKKELAQNLKAKPELVVIKNIRQIYGQMTSKAEALLYKDEKSLKETEPRVKEKKETSKKEAKPETKEKK